MAAFDANLTGTTELADSIKHEYETQFILTQVQSNIIDDVVQYRFELGSKSISMTKFGALAPVETALSETDSVASTAMSDTLIQLTPAEYGLTVTSSNLVDIQTGGSSTLGKIAVVAQNMAESKNLLGTRALEATSNIVFADDVADAAAIDTVNILDAAEFDRMFNKLDRKNIQKMPDGTYVAHMHADTAADVRANASAGSWTDVSKYSDPSMVLRNEIGTYKGFRIVTNNNCLITANQGVGAVDVYKSSFFGMNALGLAESQIPKLIMKMGNDPMDRFAWLSWYGVFKYGIIDTSAVWQVQHASAFGANV